MTALETAAVITGLVSGLGGLTLGIYNAVIAYRGSTPRLALSLGIMQLVDRTHGPGGPIEHDVGVFTVANTGSVPVFAALAFVETVTGHDLLLVSPLPLDNGPWPREVQPGHAVQLRFDVDSMANELEAAVAKRPAVKTAVGSVLFGKEEAMADFHRALVQYKNRNPKSSS